MRSRWTFAALMFVAVTTVMLWPMDSTGGPAMWPYLDKVVHFGAWFALAVATWPLVRKRIDRDLGRIVLFVVALGVWGIIIELLQGLTPTRTPDAWDALADFIGGVVGTCVMVFYDRKSGAKPAITPISEETR